LRVRLSHEPPLSSLAPSPYSLNLSAHPSDLLHRIKTVIDRNRALAKDLGISSMSGFIVGTELAPGALDVNGLNDLVAKVAERKGTGRHSTLFITKRRRKTMNTIPFTNRRSIVKGCVVGILGLAVLLGSSGVSLAEPIFGAGTTSCRCTCNSKANPRNYAILGWKKVGACQLAVGKNCSFTKDDVKYAGTLGECSQCQTTATGTDCGGPQSSQPGLGGAAVPFDQRPNTVAPDPHPLNTKPYPGQQKLPAATRGIEPESPVSAPTGQEEKATAPK
jgi:hypothetical protein